MRRSLEKSRSLKIQKIDLKRKESLEEELNGLLDEENAETFIEETEADEESEITEEPEAETEDKVDEEILEENKGILAGCPISAFLANYYLKDLDIFLIIQVLLPLYFL